MDVNADIITWGKCIQDTGFFGAPELMQLSFFIIFGLVFYKMRLPGQMALPFGTILAFTLWILNPTGWILAIMILGLLLSFGWLGFVVVNRIFK